MSFLKWLVPGMHVKRWLIVLFLGVVGFSLAVGLLMAFLYHSINFTGATSVVVATATLQFIPRVERAVLLVGVGLAIVTVSVLKLSRSLLSVLLPTPGSNVAEVIYRRRKLPRGPRVVAMGGGTGLSILLRGLKEYTSNLTAIVTVANGGSSSDAFNRDLGILSGDFRDCIVAMSDEEPLMGRLFQYQFGEGSGLEGHSFGNLFIVALSHITGSFEKALREVGRVLAVRGQILPSSLTDVHLHVESHGAARNSSSIATVARTRVQLEPADVVVYPEAAQAILDADMVILGPGSLCSSVLPNLLVPGIREALRSSRALKVFVSNVATERDESAGDDVIDHVHLLHDHVGEGLFDYVVANDNFSPADEAGSMVTLVRCSGATLNGLEDLRLVEMDIIDESNPMRHDPTKLSEALLKLYYDQAPRRSRLSTTHEPPAIKTA